VFDRNKLHQLDIYGLMVDSYALSANVEVLLERGTGLKEQFVTGYGYNKRVVG
jgi:hypothetical protein